MQPDRQKVNELIAAVAESQLNTYDRAMEVYEYSLEMCAATSAAEKWVYPQLYALWGVLTDRVEVKPEETDEAEAVMREAAEAFLAVANDDEALRLYFDWWLYEERGGFYARPAPPPKNPPFGHAK